MYREKRRQRAIYFERVYYALFTSILFITIFVYFNTAMFAARACEFKNFFIKNETNFCIKNKLLFIE